jgi:Asparagine synthase
MSLISTDNVASDDLLPPPDNQTPLLTLVWLKGGRRELDASKIVENMFRHSTGPYGLTAIAGGDATLAWGILLPKSYTPLTSWSVYSDGSELCLFEGDLYDDLPGLRVVPGENPGIAERIAAHMRKQPDVRFSELVGIYSGVYVNRERSCAYVFGDVTGTRPVFWYSNEKRLVVTGNLWAFRGCQGFERSWDRMALAQVLTMGFPMAGRTWLEGVRLLQRGRQVRSFADGRTEVRMTLDPVARASWSLEQSVHALRDSLDETVGRICRRLDGPVALGLSGGLDSRTLLASLHTQKLDHRNFTFCLSPDEADNRIAKSSAELLGEEHNTVIAHIPGLGAFHRDTLLMNEGESSGFGFLVLAARVQQESNALLIGSEEVRETPGSLQPIALKSKRELARHMLHEYLTSFPVDHAQRLLVPAFRVPWQDVLDEWFDSFEQINQDSILDVFLDHVADHRVQRRTRARLDQVRWFCLPVYPYMDDRLYGTYRRLPLSQVHAEQASIALLCSYNTGLEKLPSPAVRFGMSLDKAYRYRHLLHAGRTLRDNLVHPLKRKWRETKGAWGFGRSVLSPVRQTELPRLEQCRLFHWPEVKSLIDQAGRGSFSNITALHALINAGIIDEFVFGAGLSGSRALRFMKSTREVQLVGNSAQAEIRT